MKDIDLATGKATAAGGTRRLRPASPYSVLVIGPPDVPNVLLNVGHGALGLTLAARSADLLAKQLPHMIG